MFWRNLWQVTKTIQARLRFIAILAAVGGTIVYWDTLKAHYEKWTRPLVGEETTVSSPSEYWCPMHPTIVRDHPDKCPICGMPLSKRKKGEGVSADEALPPGVVSRVQLTPYRVALAGVQTVEVSYQPLSKEITTVGFVEFDQRLKRQISSDFKGRIDKLYVNFTDQEVHPGEALASIYSPEIVTAAQELLDARAGDREMIRQKLRYVRLSDEQIQEIERSRKPLDHVMVRAPIRGEHLWHVIRVYPVEGQWIEQGAPLYDVAGLSTVWIEAQVYEEEVAFLHEGLPVSATTKTFPGREFKGELAFVHPHLDGRTRTLTVRYNMDNPKHELRPGMYATVTLQVPVTRLNLLPSDAGDKQKQMYEKGLVLAVPERAVIDTGSRKIVYREAEPDVYEGVEVQLGPRCGVFYPVIKGLQAGDRIATAGSFLIDAETRLTAGAGSTYFGATGGPKEERRSAATTARPSMIRDEEDKVQAVLAKLSREDRRLAEAQGYCPIQVVNRLGSMGMPVKVMVKGQPVFLCCSACVNQALANPKDTLVKVEELKARNKGAPGTVPEPPATSPSAGRRETRDAQANAALAMLSAEDRRLAEAQRFCPYTGEPLGAMGLPVKVMLKGQAVLLCCKNCVDEARKHPDRMLARVQELKAKVKASGIPEKP